MTLKFWQRAILPIWKILWVQRLLGMGLEEMEALPWFPRPHAHPLSGNPPVAEAKTCRAGSRRAAQRAMGCPSPVPGLHIFLGVNIEVPSRAHETCLFLFLLLLLCSSWTDLWDLLGRYQARSSLRTLEQAVPSVLLFPETPLLKASPASDLTPVSASR